MSRKLVARCMGASVVLAAFGKRNVWIRTAFVAGTGSHRQTDTADAPCFCYLRRDRPTHNTAPRPSKMLWEVCRQSMKDPVHHVVLACAGFRAVSLWEEVLIQQHHPKLLNHTAGSSQFKHIRECPVNIPSGRISTLQPVCINLENKARLLTSYSPLGLSEKLIGQKTNAPPPRFSLTSNKLPRALGMNIGVAGVTGVASMLPVDFDRRSFGSEPTTRNSRKVSRTHDSMPSRTSIHPDMAVCQTAGKREKERGKSEQKGQKGQKGTLVKAGSLTHCPARGQGLESHAAASFLIIRHADTGTTKSETRLLLVHHFVFICYSHCSCFVLLTQRQSPITLCHEPLNHSYLKEKTNLMCLEKPNKHK